MDKIKIEKYLDSLYIELNTLLAMNAINSETFDLLNIEIDEIRKELNKDGK